MEEETRVDESLGAKPKKRGRKRKIDKLMESINSVKNTPENSISRSGRKRKQINYYELANPDGLEELTDLDFKKLKPPLIANEKKSSITKLKVNKDTNDDNGKTSSTNSIDSSYSDLTNSESINENLQGSSSMVLDESDNNYQNDVGDESQPVPSEDSSPDTSADKVEDNANSKNKKAKMVEIESDSSKEKRYSFTGETVKMMNTLFSIYKTENDGTSPEKPTNTSLPKAKLKQEIEETVAPVVNSDVVTCAICNQIMDKSIWSHHKQRYHNNLAWRIGDPPLDLSNQALVMRTLNMLYKKKKPLYCDKCGEIKKSVVGFLSHQSQCKKSEEQLESVKVACELCGKKMLPVSMMTHIKFVHTNPKKAEEYSEPSPEKQDKVIVSNKRSAAKKALKIIEKVSKNELNEDYWFTSNLNLRDQEFVTLLLNNKLKADEEVSCLFDGCDFKFKTIDVGIEHLEGCSNKPNKGMICKHCLKVSEEAEDMIHHIETAHGVQVQTKRNDNEKTSTNNNNSKLPVFLQDCPKYSTSEKNLFYKSFEWTYEFCEENYSDILFENLTCKKSDWLVLPFNCVVDYLPKLSESCSVAQKITNCFANVLNEEYNFKKYELFEYEEHEDSKLTIFCGGPISSMAWLPTPYDKDSEEQVLAVSVFNLPDANYIFHESYHERCAIQFWSLGVLNNKVKPSYKPKLMFSIAHEYGPVWHMEWCPSGCYNEKTDFGRMGLLSVAGSDSVVYIYTVPHFAEENEGLYFKVKPTIKLLLQRTDDSLLGGLKYYPKKISWAKAAQHNYIAVGYTNGLVGLFNLKIKSFLLRQKDSDGVTFILPYKIFQPHTHSITALSLHSLNGGGKWLMTGSIDRNICIWDLDNPTYPISETKKTIVTDARWFNNWIAHVCAYDESSKATVVPSAIKQARDYTLETMMNMMFSFSTLTSISTSDWLNSYIQANAAGEISCILLRHLVRPPESKHYKKRKLLFGYTYLVEKSKTPQERFDTHEKHKTQITEYMAKCPVNNKTVQADLKKNDLFCDEPLMYHDAEEKYALLFCDNKMESDKDFTETQFGQLLASSKHYHLVNPNQYPLNQINEISFNPNRQASLFYATGYQAGFVRISWIGLLKDDFNIQ